MIEKHINGLCIYEFPILSRMSGLRHGIFTRKGGGSREPFNSLNVGLSVGDSPETVEKNRQAVRHAMGDSDMVYINQVHGTRVVIHQQEADDAHGTISVTGRQGDAVISNTPGINLVIQTADCQSILLYDPVRRAVGNIHCGWRGSVQNIIGLTVARLTENFGSRPRDLLAGIGPSLGPCCAEFIHYRHEIPERLWPYKIRNHYFDFWSMSQDQLTDAGLKRENIALSNLCTRCRDDLFFSYRKEKTTGRFAAVVGLT